MLLAGLLLLLGCMAASAAPSDPDPSFGEDGYTAVQTNKACLRICVEFGGSYADALVLQPDGGIMLGGYNDYIGAPGVSTASSPPGAIVRLLPGGTLDSSFGSEGVDELPFGVGALQTDAIGGLLVLGETEGGRSGAERFTASGVLDGQYGPGGVRWLPSFEDEQRDRAGRFVGLVSVRVPASDYKGATTHLDLTRRNPSGMLDMHFGHQGYAPLPGSQEVESAALVIASDGSAIVAFKPHSQTEDPHPSRALLERFTPNGKLDRAFGRDGVARSPIRTIYGGEALSVAPDGNILLAVGEQRSYRGSGELVLAEYTPSGHLDPRFGTGGIARSQLPGKRTHYTSVEPSAITFDAAGDAIVVGKHSVKTVDTPAGDGFIARYTPRGRDCSFGEEGVLVDGNFGAIDAAAVQPDGRIVAAGWGHGKRFLAARYLGGPARTCPGEAKR